MKTQKFIPGIVLLLVLMTLSACDQTAATVDISADREALLAYHQQQQDAHLQENAELFVEMFNDPIIQLKDGNIRHNKRQDNLTRISAYFEAVEFLEWENISPPTIRIAAGGTMAYIVVHKRVRLTYLDEDGHQQEGHTVFAWLETWEKIDGEWKLMVVASTDRPGE